MKRDLFREARQRPSSKRLLRQPFRVGFTGSKSKHLHGGPARHEKARCFSCKKPLRLLWDLDLSDPALPDDLRATFPQLTRLPLYYCFNCPEATTYQVKSDSMLACLAPKSDGGDDTPYNYDADVPAELPRRSIELTPIPSIIEGLICLDDEVGSGCIDPDGVRRMTRFIRANPDSRSQMAFSQFGGQPHLLQGHMSFPCPNAKCPSLQYEDDERFEMKILAVVEQDGLQGFQWVCAPLAFHACWVCGTIQGVFQCT